MASSSKLKKTYDIFLSFRGVDVRNNFLSHLYKALDQNGIYTFRDSEELRKGDQISMALMEAIKESCIAIIIFSENYASSWWCLEELAKIMECNEQNDLTVLPVFYKVEPREVRGGRKSYQTALAKHEYKFRKDSEKVKRWKEALVKAGNLSGWHLNDGDESEFIQGIVKEIFTHLGRTPLHVAKHPVGIDTQVDKLKSMLNLESKDDIVMVGLWGQGGMGKTTLARALYNAIFRQFEGSCLLEDVRKASKDSKNLALLQEKLLSEILLLQERLEVSSISKGINLIQHRLHHKKILLVLDDVDDLHQLNALAGEGKWFGNGSRIIVTTRDSHLLSYHGIDQDHVYEVKALNNSEAHELLTNHAFPAHQKLKIRTDLVNSVLDHARGLPLALEVLGSFLCGRSERAWESTLRNLSKIPNKTINDVLKISYDGLEENEKEIFLHVACFFTGRYDKYVVKVLDSCDLETTIGLEILIERSLIRIDSKIEMHDLIQFMGVDIVNQECRDNPRRRSRLWRYGDVFDVLSNNVGDCTVKAIVLELPKPTKLHISPDAFAKMRNLRLLILHNVRDSFEGPICLPNELRWFEWPGCARKIPEFSSGPKKLVGLYMSEGNTTRVVKQFKDFQNLTYINFSGCNSMVHMPDFSCTPNLKELNFACCKNLVEAHESIAYLDKLEVLYLGGCSELSVFPNVLNSKNLRQFAFCGTKFERFPDIPHILKGFKYLSCSNTAIKELPTSIENLVNLKTMWISSCENLKCLPYSIYKLENLTSLVIMNCQNLIGFSKYEDSADLCMKAGLSNLHHLCFEGCNQLQEIPELPPFLTHFYVWNCESLQKKEDPIPIHHIVRACLTISDKRFEEQPKFLLPQGEMPQWIFPIEEDSIFFKVSKDLYDKIIGVAHCIVLKNDQKVEDGIYLIDWYVNGKRVGSDEGEYKLSDLDYVAIEYSHEFWGEVDFVQIAGHYIQLGVGVRSRIVKKWGFRIICKQLGDDLKAELRDNQLIDPALLYEVGHGSIDLAAESSHVHEDNLREANLQEDLQDCQMSTRKHTQIVSHLGLMELDLLKNFQDCQMSLEEHSQRGPKRKDELILPQGWLHL